MGSPKQEEVLSSGFGNFLSSAHRRIEIETTDSLRRWEVRVMVAFLSSMPSQRTGLLSTPVDKRL